MDAPLIVLEIYIILLSRTLETAAHTTPLPLQESSPGLYKSPPLQSVTHHFTPNFCHVGASLEDISLDDCGSCQGRCGALNTMDRQQGLCSCDSACTVYDDCCWDFQRECPELHERAVEIRNAFDITPSSICFTMRVLFINSCERTIYAHPDITGAPDPHTQIPVLDLDTAYFTSTSNVPCVMGRSDYKLLKFTWITVYPNITDMVSLIWWMKQQRPLRFLQLTKLWKPSRHAPIFLIRSTVPRPVGVPGAWWISAMKHVTTETWQTFVELVANRTH